jgi:hypothetical protein
LTETYELENIIKELYNLEETIGNTETSTITEDLLQAKVHEIVFRLRVWKENNYDKLREALNTWNTADRLLKGEISEVEPNNIEDIIRNLQQRAGEMKKQVEDRE